MLSNLSIDTDAIICRVQASPELYKRLYALGLRIGIKIKVIRLASFNGPIHVRIGTTDLVLRRDLATHIIVSVVK